MFSNTLRFIVAYDNNHIYGLIKFAWTSTTNAYNILYCSVNKNYLNLGFSKKMIKLLFNYFKSTYPDECLHTSQYSLDGWKFIRPIFLFESIKQSVDFNDNVLGYIFK